MPNPIQHPLPRLLENSEVEGECLVWKRHTTWNGYGTLKVNNKTKRAHRVMFELMNGPIPEGMMVLHSCDNPPCILPAHLRLGTAKDNANDMVERDRLNTGGKKGKTYPHLQKEKCKRGHNDWYAGKKRCRTCKNEREKKYRERKK